jgi:hypothetical protein
MLKVKYLQQYHIILMGYFQYIIYQYHSAVLKCAIYDNSGKNAIVLLMFLLFSLLKALFSAEVSCELAYMVCMCRRLYYKIYLLCIY